MRPVHLVRRACGSRVVVVLIVILLLVILIVILIVRLVVILLVGILRLVRLAFNQGVARLALTK